MHTHLAARHRPHPGQCLREFALAVPGHTGDRHDFTCVHIECDAVQRLVTTVAGGIDVVQFERGLAKRASMHEPP